MKTFFAFTTGVFSGMFLLAYAAIVREERENKQKNNVDEGYQPKHAKESELSA